MKQNWTSDVSILKIFFASVCVCVCVCVCACVCMSVCMCVWVQVEGEVEDICVCCYVYRWRVRWRIYVCVVMYAGGGWGGGGAPTVQHGEVHGVVGPLGDAEHDLQAVLDLTLPFLTASQQLLYTHTHTHIIKIGTMEAVTMVMAKPWRWLYGGGVNHGGVNHGGCNHGDGNNGNGTHGNWLWSALRRWRCTLSRSWYLVILCTGLMR